MEAEDGGGGAALRPWSLLSFPRRGKAPLVAQMVKNLPAMQETVFNPWVWNILWGREWQPTPLFLPGKFQEQRGPGGLQSMGLQSQA